MIYWQIFLIVAIASFVLEMFTPTMFFLSIAVAALITAILSLWYVNLHGLIIICSVLSVIILLFIRPWMKKFMHDMPKGVDFHSEYIGKIVKATEEITNTSGSITVYEERWEARLADPESAPIPAGSGVRIVRNESIVLYVEAV